MGLSEKEYRLIGSEIKFIRNCSGKGDISGEAGVGGIVGELKEEAQISSKQVEATVIGQREFGMLMDAISANQRSFDSEVNLPTYFWLISSASVMTALRTIKSREDLETIQNKCDTIA